MTITSEAEVGASGTASPEDERPAANETEAATLFGALDEWQRSLRVVFARAIDLTVLEARLAALNFALILIVAVASGLLLASAWIALFAAIVATFHALGLSWPLAFLLMAAINLALAGAGGYAIYRMSNNLLFKAIRKFILYGEPPDPYSTHPVSQEDIEPAAHKANTPAVAGNQSVSGERNAAAGSATGNPPTAP